MFCSCIDDSHCLVALHPRSNHYKLYQDRKRKEQERFNSLIMTLFIPRLSAARFERPRTPAAPNSPSPSSPLAIYSQKSPRRSGRAGDHCTGGQGDRDVTSAVQRDKPSPGRVRDHPAPSQPLLSLPSSILSSAFSGGVATAPHGDQLSASGRMKPWFW